MKNRKGLQMKALLRGGFPRRGTPGNGDPCGGVSGGGLRNFRIRGTELEVLASTSFPDVVLHHFGPQRVRGTQECQDGESGALGPSRNPSIEVHNVDHPVGEWEKKARVNRGFFSKSSRVTTKTIS